MTSSLPRLESSLAASEPICNRNNLAAEKKQSWQREDDDSECGSSKKQRQTLDFQLTNLNKGKGSQGLTALQAPSTHTFVKDSPPRQGSYKEMSGESKGVIG